MKLGVTGVVVVALTLPLLVHAQIVITEIMYDPHGSDSGREWIEVYNESDISISLTHWKLFENDSRHNILSAGTNGIITPHSYAVIAENVLKFHAEYPDPDVTLFHSAFSLANTGTTIELLDASSTIVDSVSYDSAWGAVGDGNSLQKDPSGNPEFSPHIPTPGSVMSAGVFKPTVAIVATSDSSRHAKKISHSTPKKSPKTKSPAGSAAPDIYVPDLSLVPSTTSETVYTAAGATPDSPLPWWLGVGALTFIAGGAVFASRRAKKSEWDIIEEKPEDV